MKNNSIRCFFTIVLCMLIQLSFSQNDNISSNFNLPPGAKFSNKKFVKIDFSNKLSQNLNLPLNKDFIKINDKDLIQLKQRNREAFNYYNKAKNYFFSLSEKVLRTYTEEELWYIYMYDSKLKNHLTTIK